MPKTCHACDGKGYVVVKDKTTLAGIFGTDVYEKQKAQVCPVCGGSGKKDGE